MKNPIFLISTGRTGTKYFANFFQTYGKNVVSFHTSRFTRLINVLSNMYYQKVFSEIVMNKLWKQMKYKEICSYNLRYIECNPYYYNLLDIISHSFPEAKFIFVIRAPRSFIVSHINWERQRWQSLIANRLIPFWQPVSYLEQVKGIGNDYHQRVAFYSNVWLRKNTSIINSIARKDTAVTLKYEDIFNENTGVDVMMNLMDWLDVPLAKPITGETVTQRVNMTKKTPDTWDDVCTDIVKKQCGQLMSKFGYL